MKLANKHIFVTGGAKGIGEAIVKDAAAEGAAVSFIDIDTANGEKLVAQLSGTGQKVFFAKADVSRFEDLKSAFNQAVGKFGEVTGVVNNAGVNDGVGLENGNYEAFISSIHKNLVHYYLMAHYALPALKAAKGSIVNISSKTADTGQGGTSPRVQRSSTGGSSGYGWYRSRLGCVLPHLVSSTSYM